MRPILVAASSKLVAIPGDGWTSDAIDAALDPLPDELDAKKRVVFQAIRAAVCGNLVSPPLGVVLELVGKSDALARITRAETMAK